MHSAGRLDEIGTGRQRAGKSRGGKIIPIQVTVSGMHFPSCLALAEYIGIAASNVRRAVHDGKMYLLERRVKAKLESEK
jgi:hypothetical protein